MEEENFSELARHTRRGAVLTLGAQACQFAVKVATQILIARLLVPADYGLIAMVTPVLSLCQLLGDLGLGQATIIQRDIPPGEISAMLWFGLALNCVLAAGVMALSPLVAWFYGEPRLVPVVLVLAGLLPVTGTAVQHITFMNRALRFSTLAAIDVAAPSAALAVGLVVARAGWGYWSLVAAIAAETLTHGALAWTCSSWRPSRPRRGMPIGRLLRIGSHFQIGNLAGYLTTSVDNVLLGVVKGPDALGLYNRGYRLVTQPVLQLLIPLSRVAFPLLNRLRPDRERYRRAWADMLTALALAGMPGLLWVMSEARPLVRLLLGAQWAGAAPVIAWLCLGALASPLNAGSYWLFVTQERTKTQMQLYIATSLIAVASFVGGLRWGPVGVSAASALSALMMSAPLTCWAATRAGPVRLAHAVRAILPLAVATAVTAGVLHVAHRTGEDAVTVLGMAMLSYGCFAGVLACLPGSLVRRVWRMSADLRWFNRAGA